jgi:hypothetical protein
MLLNFSNQILIIEIRSEETRKVRFVALDLHSNKLLWEQDSLSETWWIGLFATEANTVVIHGFKDLQNPVHQKVYVLDIWSGKQLWKNEDYKAIKLIKNLLYVSTEGKETILQLDSASGKYVEELTLESFKALAENNNSERSELAKALHYSKENQYFRRLATFIEQLTSKEAEKLVDYLEHKSKIIVSFYSTEAEKLVNYILVTDEEGQILFQDTIAEGLSTVALESFFLWKDQLIFIKNRKELVIFEL